jgi:hypothetical protein
MRDRSSIWERVAVIAAIVVFLGVGGALLDAADEPDVDVSIGPDDFQLEAAPIDSAELLFAPEGDGVVIVHILAGLPGGCHSFDSYDIQLVDPSEGRVSIDVWNRIPVSDEPLSCTAIYGMHDLIIEPPPELDGLVRTVVINGEITLDIENGPTSYRR